MPDTLLAGGQILTDLFDGGFAGVCHGSHGPRGKPPARNARRAQKVLFGRTQQVQLDLQHLLQSLGHPGIDLLGWNRQDPSLAIPGDPPLPLEAFQQLHHEQGITVGIVMNQAGQNGIELARRKLHA